MPLDAEDIKKLADGTTRICNTPKDEPGTFDVGPLPADRRLDVHYLLDNGPERVDSTFTTCKATCNLPKEA